MRWKREGVGRLRRSLDPGVQSERERLRGELERRGVAADFSEALASKLEPQLEGRPPATRRAVLDGVATAYAVESQASEELARQLREIGELERLMKSFAGELSKLDESLEVLAAYLRRMRTRSTGEETARILH